MRTAACIRPANGRAVQGAEAVVVGVVVVVVVEVVVVDVVVGEVRRVGRRNGSVGQELGGEVVVASRLGVVEVGRTFPTRKCRL